MSRPLPEIEPVEGIQGYLWDTSKPLVQICSLVYPQRVKQMTNALLESAGQRIEDKKDTMEGIIVGVIQGLSPEGLPEWAIKTEVIGERVNRDRPESHKVTSQYTGKKLKAMGIRTRHIQGRCEAILRREAYDAPTQGNPMKPEKTAAALDAHAT